VPTNYLELVQFHILSHTVMPKRMRRQWWRHTRACQGKCPGRNASAL